MKKILMSVNVGVIYLPEKSVQEPARFLWSYEVTISNDSEEIVQLLNRYWRITDMTGHTEEIRGPGVIGLQPVIKPGKKFVYSSFCQLTTPQGTMEGHYEMQAVVDEVQFAIQIPKFALATPEGVSAAFRSRLH